MLEQVRCPNCRQLVNVEERTLVGITAFCFVEHKRPQIGAVQTSLSSDYCQASWSPVLPDRFEYKTEYTYPPNKGSKERQ